MAKDNRNIMKHFLQKHIVLDGEVDDLKDRLSRRIAGLRQLKQECLEVSLAIEKISKDYRSERKNEATTLPEALLAVRLSANEGNVGALKPIGKLPERKREATATSQTQLISEHLYESFKVGSLPKFKGYHKIEDIQVKEIDIAGRVQAYRDYLKKGETGKDLVSLLPRVETTFKTEGETKQKTFSPKRSI